MKKQFMLLILLNTLVFAQYLENNPNSGVGIPFFRLNTYRVYQGTAAYVIAVSEILYDDLTFQYEDENYQAKYDINVFIQDEDGEQNLGYLARHYRINLDSFGETNSREKKDRRSFQFQLKPGTYQLVAVAMDLNNGKSVKRTTELTIEDINENKILVSDIAFYKVNPLTGERLITLNSNFNRNSEQIWAHVSIASLNKDEPVEIQIDYGNNSYLYKSEIDTTLAPAKLTEFWHLVNLSKAKKSINEFKITANQDGEEHESIANVTFFWTEIPQTADDMKAALKQMIYVAPEDSLDKYLEMDKSAQEGYFQRFWKSVDPSPKTKQNELKDEYFSRINQANRAFSFFKSKGCFTDRGRIYIKFGSPDEVDRHPFEDYSMPYEVWYYHALKKKFLFVDTNGIGEYRLDPDYYMYEFN